MMRLLLFLVPALCLFPSSAALADGPVATITLSMTPVAPISPLLYGVNYTWDWVPQTQFREWNDAMTNIAHYTLVQYPGGWNPERYEWTANQEPKWGDSSKPWNGHYDPAKDEPGVDPDTLLSLAPNANFVTPDAPAVRDPSKLDDMVKISADIARKYGDRVKIWDIGNEWWLQGGGGAKREQRLSRYAALVAAVVPAMKAAHPSAPIFATGDWNHPEEFATMRSVVGPRVWDMLDGVSIHTYCAMTKPPGGDGGGPPPHFEPFYNNIPAMTDAVRSAAGKDKIFDSQWLVSGKNTPDNYGIKNANYLVQAFQELAFARIYAGIIWPVTSVLPGLNFVSPDYKTPDASGLLFGWMSKYYEGQALKTGGDIPAAAALNGKAVTVLIPTGKIGTRTVRIALKDTGLTQVASAEVMSSQFPDLPNKSREVRISPLATSLTPNPDGGKSVEFTVNPGTEGRGANWEIVRVTLQ